MKKKMTKGYLEYRERFYKEKKEYNIKKGVRLFTEKEYKEFKSYGFSSYQMVKSQSILKTKAEKKAVWDDYKRLKKSFERGQVKEFETYDVSTGEFSGESLTYHYNLKGLMKDGKTVHKLIAARIGEGQSRKEVLSDYGY